MSKNLTIVGIDPGTTAGIAILDAYGKVLAIDSIRGAHFSELIEKVLVYGTVIAIGTDKKAIPQLISRFAAKTGCKIFSPKQDLGKAEKQKLVSNYDVKGHAADALAAALFAFGEIKPLIVKIERFLEEGKKSYLFEDVVKLVILKEMAIRRAIDLIEQPKSEVERIVRKSKESPDKQILEKEAKGFPLILKYKKLKNGEGEKIKELKEFLANLSNKALIKKLDDLSYKEILRKSYLNIKEGDILLIKDATIFDKDGINFLKDKVSIIICKKKTSQALPFVVIDAKNLKLEEIDDFAAVERQELEREKNSISVLRKIVEEYKKGRIK